MAFVSLGVDYQGVLSNPRGVPQNGTLHQKRINMDKMNKIEVEQFLEELALKLSRKPKVRAWQACRWKVRTNHLTFEVCGLLFTGNVDIEINDNQDAYNIYMSGRFGKLDHYIPNVDGKNLVQCLDIKIENPLNGHYFDMVKKYARHIEFKQKHVL